jgi:hypothetical protein
MSWKQLAVLAIAVASYLLCLWLAERRRHRLRTRPEPPPPTKGPASAALAVPEPIEDAPNQRYRGSGRAPLDESLTGRVDVGGQQCQAK